MQAETVRQGTTAIVLCAALVIASLPHGIWAQTPPAKPAPAQAKPAPAQAAPAAAAVSDRMIDGGWPRAYISGAKAEVLLYQPQIASWDGQKHMVAYAAIAYQPQGQGAKSTMGTVRVEADTAVSIEDRLVRFSPLKMTETNFGTLPKEQVQDILATIDQGIPDDERIIALDRVLAGLDRSQIFPKNVEGVKADPPTIFYSTSPAVMVGFDGNPIWSPIRDNDLKFAVNTNWDVFEHEATKTYFLRNERVWLKTANLLKGPWTPAGKLPESFAKLPAEENWKEVKASLPGGAVGSVPTVYVSTAPSELILVSGAPIYQPVTATRLVWVSNSESDVFRLGAAGPVYYLVSGRWFTAPGFTGPWTFATQNLPGDFLKISLEHPRSRVLASVPGTSQAAEAVLLAQVPQTARVNRKTVQPPEVDFQGTPEFQPVEKTSVARAVNTDKDIIKVGDLYYMCFQGVWFMARSASGPWSATDTVPKEIYEIPSSSPSHHVTYVTVEDDDDDEWITYAAVAGYTGTMVAWGCVVAGSGWYYPPYVWYGGYYPVYYPYYRLVRIRCLVQPVDGCVHPGRRGVWPIRRRGRGREVQPENGDLLAWRRGMGPRWCAWRGHGVQPADGRLRFYPARFGRIWQLGQHISAAWRPVGADRARDQPRDGQHDARHAGKRGRYGCHAKYPGAWWQRRGENGQRRRVRGTRRKCVPQAGRQLAEVRQRIVGIGRQTDADRSRKCRSNQPRN